jgi:4-amino-4-deoxy-L-arabinose transferase-like glycosyltransferase
MRLGIARHIGALAPLAAIVLVGLLVRVVYLGEPQLFRDEAASWYLASQPLGSLFGLSAHETFPPLYTLILKSWMAVFGDTEAALRSVSVVAGVATVLVTWRWARDTVGIVAATVAASLVALSPALVLSSRNARMYSLETFFAVGAWWTVWLLVADGAAWSARRRRLAACALVLAVAGEVWSMSLGIPTAALQLAFAMIGATWLRNRAAVMATGCVLAGAASVAPWLPNLISVAAGIQPFWTPRPDAQSVAATLGGWLLGDVSGAWVVVAVLACGLAVLGLAALCVADGRGSRRDRLLALALAMGVGLVPAVWLYSQIRSIYDPRYLGAAFPPFALAVGAAAAAIARWLGSRRQPFGALARGLLTSLLVVPMVAAMALGVAGELDRSRGEANVEPGRQLVATLSTLVRPGDVVLTLNAQTYFPLEYYLVDSGEARRLGVRLYDWHRPTAAFFTGWQDIDGAGILDATKIADSGWEGAAHLAPGGSLWLVTLVDPGYEFPLFAPLQTGAVREIRRIDVGGGGPTAQVREAVPVQP